MEWRPAVRWAQRETGSRWLMWIYFRHKTWCHRVLRGSKLGGVQNLWMLLRVEGKHKPHWPGKKAGRFLQRNLVAMCLRSKVGGVGGGRALVLGH